jgi:hypothetical protein
MLVFLRLLEAHLRTVVCREDCTKPMPSENCPSNFRMMWIHVYQFYIQPSTRGTFVRSKDSPYTRCTPPTLSMFVSDDTALRFSYHRGRATTTFERAKFDQLAFHVVPHTEMNAYKTFSEC